MMIIRSSLPLLLGHLEGYWGATLVCGRWFAWHRPRSLCAEPVANLSISGHAIECLELMKLLPTSSRGSAAVRSAWLHAAFDPCVVLITHMRLTEYAIERLKAIFSIETMIQKSSAWWHHTASRMKSFLVGRALACLHLHFICIRRLVGLRFHSRKIIKLLSFTISQERILLYPVWAVNATECNYWVLCNLSRNRTIDWQEKDPVPLGISFH